MPAALTFALQLMELLPAIRAGISGAIEAAEWGASAIKKMVEENRDPTDEEWEELNQRTKQLRDELHTD